MQDAFHPLCNLQSGQVMPDPWSSLFALVGLLINPVVQALAVTVPVSLACVNFMDKLTGRSRQRRTACAQQR